MRTRTRGEIRRGKRWRKDLELHSSFHQWEDLLSPKGPLTESTIAAGVIGRCAAPRDDLYTNLCATPSHLSYYSSFCIQSSPRLKPTHPHVINQFCAATGHSIALTICCIIRPPSICFASSTSRHLSDEVRTPSTFSPSASALYN